MKHTALFSPLQLGAIRLPNRIVMAPMTRMRAGPGNVPTALNAEYYAQRASAGLIIAEGTAISADAQGYPNAPGIYTPAQIAGWKRVTDAVHHRGGRIVLQLAHNGRNSHSSLMPDGGPPRAPSATVANIPALTRDFQQVPPEMPREVGIAEIGQIVASFREAAEKAMEAGFDGVELQGANSHLIDQFLEDGTNRRLDSYGGSPENRARFLLEIVEQVGSAVGHDRLGVRLSPFGQYGGIHDSNVLQLFSMVIKSLNGHIAYLHLIEGRGSELGLSDTLHADALNNARLFRPVFKGHLISAAAYAPDSAVQAVESAWADAIAFGRHFLANPDLVERIREGWPLMPYDRSTFYGGSAHGYTDYGVHGVA
ncbi:alkene reductase [Nevskia soli]|uniref:alkene reductase n=1 Tax=Nevskia soli TaxID=418856 RepID=UPI0004A749A2|nr:alkene reductase [Nevskia soli]